jgi:hypothetical protein
LQAITPLTPANVVEAVVNQEDPAAAGGFQAVGQTSQPLLGRYPFSLILHLPHHPAPCENSPDPQALGRITAVAVAHGIDQHLMEAELDLGEAIATGKGLEQQLHQRR